MDMMIKTGGRYRKATAAEVCEVAGRYALESLNRSRPTLASPRSAIEFLQQIYLGRDYETFTVLFLDKRHRLIEALELFRGTIDGASVHPREIAKVCLWKGAAAVLCSHNHPSGVAEPSDADEQITCRLKEALALIEVKLLDHIIIGSAGQSCSLVERGII